MCRPRVSQACEYEEGFPGTSGTAGAARVSQARESRGAEGFPFGDEGKSWDAPQWFGKTGRCLGFGSRGNRRSGRPLSPPTPQRTRWRQFPCPPRNASFAATPSKVSRSFSNERLRCSALLRSGQGKTGHNTMSKMAAARSVWTHTMGVPSHAIRLFSCDEPQRATLRVAAGGAGLCDTAFPIPPLIFYRAPAFRIRH